MNIDAKYFGSVDYTEEDVLYIVNGLIGFEGQTRYLPLSFDDTEDSMISLQSLEEPSLSFVLLNPFSVFSDYTPVISDRDLELLEAESADVISFMAISVIKEPVSESTLNLKAPLAINTVNRKARQIILEDPAYTFHHKLGPTKKGEKKC